MADQIFLNVGSQRFLVLLVGEQQLAQWVYSPQAQLILALPGENLTIVQGAIQPRQVLSGRPSYINAILIQSRGRTVGQECGCCAGRAGLRPFLQCRTAGPEHFDGACGNCKWRDHAARCTFVQWGPDEWEEAGYNGGWVEDEEVE